MCEISPHGKHGNQTCIASLCYRAGLEFLRFFNLPPLFLSVKVSAPPIYKRGWKVEEETAAADMTLQHGEAEGRKGHCRRREEKQMLSRP